MRSSRSCPLVLVLLGAIAAGCRADAPRPAGECAAELFAGDLVISEIMANPAGPDADGLEWFEIYNATSQPLDLSGLALRYSRENGTDEEEHFVDGLEIGGNAYVVVANYADEGEPPAYVDYAFGNDLGDFRGEDSRVAIACSDNLVDEAFYDVAEDGIATGYDGARTPDANGNDDLAAWCGQRSMIDELSYGTPGAPNDPCGAPTTCTVDGEPRDIVAPAVGDLVITEFHPNPAAVAEETGDWFEVYVAADRAIDINGLEFGREAGEPDGILGTTECISVEPGTYLLFAHSDDPAANGGLENITAVVDLPLKNSGEGRLYIGLGGVELDFVTWTSSDEGAATQLDKDFLDPAANDDAQFFCPATEPFGAGDLGTPGRANGDCPIPVPPGMCFEGETLVAVDPPAAGEIVITEFMANPEASEETDGEWVEITALGDFHLNGLELGRTPGEVDSTIEIEPCTPVAAGERIVIAREADTAINGGLPAVAATFDVSLVNSDGSLFVGYGGEVLDAVTWDSTTAAAATSLDPDAIDPTANDDLANWCPAVDAYGDGDLGTPGAENPACGGSGSGMCNDGGNERPIVAPAPGDLVITEVMPDPNAVADAEGEWFEVLVTADVDLNGLELGAPAGDADTTLPVDGDCLSVAAGTRIVFAQNADAAANGGLPDPFATFTFGLTNAGGSVSVGRGGVVLDAVSWADSDPGVALNLDPEAEDTVANDDPLAFCAATMPYGDGDLGTPGSVNTDCGDVIPGGMCDDGGNLRAIVAPALGDLVLTEVMPNPDAVTDAAGEWFEIAVLADVDLNGLELSVPGANGLVLQDTLASTACLEVTAGSFVVLARSTDPLVNGGLPVVDYAFTFGLVNADDGLALGVGGEVIDEISWTTTPTGASRSLDPDSLDATANDDGTNWCPGATVYGLGDEGTPGAANEQCA